MTRAPVLFAVLVLAVASVGLYRLKYDVAALESERDRLAAELADQRAAIRVLDAEWAYLSRADRLADLATRRLGLVPLDADHFTTFADIPLRDTMLAEVAPGAEPAR